MLTLRKASDRGLANHGWLKSFHTFSFASYRNPREQGFSDLLVINDDRVAAGKGFGQHPHRDMEIFSYVLEGALELKDTLGTGSVIRPGDVQLMSAGSGVAHSEFNHSATRPVHFLQIWIVPEVAGAKPRYQQEHFSAQKKRGRLQLIISPDGADGSLKVRQDARVFAGLFEPLGFILSSILIGIPMARLYGGRWLPSIVVTTLMAIGLYLLFDRLMDVPLPLGLLDVLEN